MRVIVVGGGIAGLSVAIALRAKGHDVVVLERAARLDRSGAGITLFGNAMRALDRLGVQSAVAAHGTPAKWSAVLTSEGRELARVPPDLLEGTIAVHRAELQRELAAACGEVRLGVEVTEVEQRGDGVVARNSDGLDEWGDLLIGADGLGSVVRAAIADVRPRYAGYTAWRGVSPVKSEEGRMTESWGVGERFGLVDIGHGRTYWFATKNAPERELDEPEGRKAELERRFSSWHEPISSTIRATGESEILRNDVYYIERLPRWSVGSVTLVGDAAHATTPGIGQGAAQAIEDAVVLADRLTTDIPVALAQYEAIRRPRAEAVLKVSRRVDRMGQTASPLGCRLRNSLVRRTPERAQHRQLEPIVGGGL